MSNYNFDESAATLRKAETVVRRILESHTDITADYNDWMLLAFSLSSLGEEGRKLFIDISSVSPKFNLKECEEKFDHIKGTSQGKVGIGTFFDIAKRHGIDISMPKGRPQKTIEQRQEESRNKMQAGMEYLASHYMLRYNVWTHRAEMQVDGKWRPITDRDVDSIYCTMRTEGISISDKDVRALLSFNKLVKEYDAIREWLDSLPDWEPSEGDDIEAGIFKDDPIREFFEHILFVDEENHEFYIHYLRKWFVGLAGMMLGVIDEHNILLVLCGKQHKGKTYLIRRILPPELSEYRYDANPSAHVDKDFIISLSEFVLIFLDEFSFGNNAKSDAYKFIVSSTTSNERDAYGHFREKRRRRAALVAATNHKRYIKDPEGDRRYLSVDVAGTVNLHEHPLDYRKAYAMAKYLLLHGYKTKPTAEESECISKHNEAFMELNDCEEVIKTYFRAPLALEPCKALSSAEIMQKLRNNWGIFGKGFSTNEIGRTLKRLGYEPHIIKGTNKYMIVAKTSDELMGEGERDAQSIRESQTNPEAEMPEVEDNDIFGGNYDD